MFRSPILLLLLVLPGVLLPSCSSPGPTESEKLELYTGNAFRYYYLGEFERAQEQAQKGLAIEPDDYELRLVLGRVLQHRGTLGTVTQATEIFRELRKERGDDDRVLIGLGESYEREGVAYDITAREIESGERITNAADPEARVVELRERARDRWEKSYEAFAAAWEVKRRTPQANGLQRTSSMLGNSEESLRWSNVLLDLLDEQIRSWKQQLERVELTAADEQRWRKNLADDEALKVQTLLFMSSILAPLGRHEEAIAALDKLLEIEPDLPEAYSRRAYHQMKLGRYQRAVDSLDTFIAKTIDRPFEDPAVTRAYEMLDEAKAQLASTSEDGE